MRVLCRLRYSRWKSRFTIGHFETKLRSAATQVAFISQMRGGRRAVNATPILLKEDLPSKCASHITSALFRVLEAMKKSWEIVGIAKETHNERKRNKRKTGRIENIIARKHFLLYFHLCHTRISDKGDVKVFLRLTFCL